MTDRQPALGKEGRVLITPENGSPPFYATLEMADDPLDAGTPLCKLTLLSDEACDFLDIPRSSVPSEAFIKLSFGAGMYGYRVTLLTQDGRPAKGVKISGIMLPGGGDCVTDDRGQTIGVGPANVMLSVQSPYIDCEPATVSASSSGNVITEITIKFRRIVKSIYIIETSDEIQFSPDVAFLDACAIGAGSSGWSSADTGGEIATGGGAGGSIENRFNIPYTGEKITVTVGANAGKGTAGSTVISGLQDDIIGEGAIGPATVRPPSPATSKNGGSGAVKGVYGGTGPGSNGSDRTAFPFDDESILCSGGGGTGGVRQDPDGVGYPGGKGGKSGGGAGGDGGGYNGNSGYPGLYYGSGGGGPGLSYRDSFGAGGDGKDGAAMFRARFKS